MESNKFIYILFSSIIFIIYRNITLALWEDSDTRKCFMERYPEYKIYYFISVRSFIIEIFTPFSLLSIK